MTESDLLTDVFFCEYRYHQTYTASRQFVKPQPNLAGSQCRELLSIISPKRRKKQEKEKKSLEVMK